MKVNYLEISRIYEPKSDILFLKNGNLWFFFSLQRKSRYFGGFLFFQGQALRFLDSIHFNDEILEINILSTQEVILFLRNNQVYLKLNNNSLDITLSSWQDINLHLDIKDIFKNESEKRKIEIERISSCCLILNCFLEGNGYVKILIEADSPLEFRKNWFRKEMDFDRKRNSPPYEWFVLDGVYGKVKELKIKILEPKITPTSSEIVIYQKNDLLNFLLSRIQTLILDNYLPAGFPWFYENWFRDELLTLYFLQDVLKKEFREQRLRFYLNNLSTIWNLNKPNINEHREWSGADTYPLLILNLDDVLFYSHSTLLEKYFHLWQENFLKNNEFALPPYSTWMDTLERKSALEIESLYLKVLRRFAKGNKFYLEEANKQKERLVEKIKKSESDPNLIFSFLLLEDLFSLKEWENFFAKLIKNNYLEWGGFSTLAKDNINFKNEDDGELGKAYHQGDSWYFLNNLIAFALNKINSKKYKEIIDSIINASFEDLFLDGALGYSSEISSAKERRSEGALVQLWSLSSLIYFFLKSEYQPQIFEQ